MCGKKAPRTSAATCKLWVLLLFSCSAPRTARGGQSLRPLDIAVKKRGQLGLGEGADAGRLDVAVLEQHQRRDAADAELGRHLLVLVDVDLGDLQPPAILLGEVVEDRRDRLARPAPLGPVVDQHRRVGFQHLRFEGGVSYVMDIWVAHRFYYEVAHGDKLRPQ